jgi:hypothetical protein
MHLLLYKLEYLEWYISILLNDGNMLLINMAYTW